MALADERFAVLGDFFADFLDDLVLQPSSPCNARSFVVLVSFATLEIFDALEALASSGFFGAFPDFVVVGVALILGEKDGESDGDTEGEQDGKDEGIEEGSSDGVRDG